MAFISPGLTIVLGKIDGDILAFLIQLSLLGVLLVYFAVESYLLNKWREGLKYRVCVTGTRGKSSVVRLIHAGLNVDEGGYIAKVTGTRASFLYPDGHEEEVGRAGPTSILEQRRLIRKAHVNGFSGFIAEIMSIAPENHMIEANKLLRPNYLAVTRIHEDHLFRMGDTKKKVGETIALTVPNEGNVILSNDDLTRYAPWAFAGNEVDVKVAGDDLAPYVEEITRSLGYFEFRENVRLALEVCRSLGVPVDEAVGRMKDVRPDPGALMAWRLSCGGAGKYYFLVSGFATNDPSSALEGFNRATGNLSSDLQSGVVGILNIRQDRGSRSAQWIDELNNGFPIKFKKLILTGTGPEAVAKRLKIDVPDLLVMKTSSPQEITRASTNDIESRSIIFGFGNVKGAGEELIEYWSSAGERYGN